MSNKSVDDVDEELLKKYTNQAHEVGRIAISYTDKQTVLKLVDIAESYIKSNIHWRVEFTGALQRTEIPEIPVDAIREALLNSFCHKDYSSGQSNEVAIYKDRVEIYNPGTFPEGFEPQDFIDRPERPIRRKPKIARILYYSKDIESFGTGLKRIADACDNAKVRYEFKKLKSGFVVCFYRSEADEAERAKKEPKRSRTKSKYFEGTKRKSNDHSERTGREVGINQKANSK